MRTVGLDHLSFEILTRQLKGATLFVLAVFGLLILRLWFLQVVNGPTYRTSSENNRIHLHNIPPFRGMIFDRSGGLLVGNYPRYDLCVIPEGVRDREDLISSLNRLIGLEPEPAKSKMDKASLRNSFRPICLKKNMSRNELGIIETHRFNLPGINIKVEPQRLYVGGDLASHLLGYLGEITKGQLKSGKWANIRQGDLIGKSGVERKWQAFLNGVRGGEQMEVDAAGRKIRTISRKPSVAGANVYLSIDRDLQRVAEKALKGKMGAIAAIDPNNGQILAMASSPSFDPNLFVRGIDSVTWRKIVSSGDFPLENRALKGQYPPGSVFKIVVALAGLEEGVIRPDEKVLCNGLFPFAGHDFHCWKEHGHGAVNLYRALKESCDVYFYKMGRRLGVDRIAKYAGKLGLGKKTGFQAGQEKAGLIPTSAWKLKRFGIPWQAGETISTSIGQSYVLVTPIQMANLIAAVFNGGLLFKPQATMWVEKTETDKSYQFTPILAGKAGIKPDHMELVKKALIGVVNEPHGTASKARLKHITVAGKTGTAQVVALEKDFRKKKEKEVPLKFRDHAWFVAAAPAQSPKIALAVVVEHGGHGGSAAAPIAREMIEAYLGAGQGEAD